MEPKEIMLSGMMDKNPTALLHLIRTVEDKAVEIKELKKHIEHLKDTGKDCSKKQLQLKALVASKDSLSKSEQCVEVKLWCVEKINPGDEIKAKFLFRKFIVVAVVECKNHSGAFVSALHSKDTFYTIHAKYVR
jgi:hypothetical protein